MSDPRSTTTEQGAQDPTLSRRSIVKLGGAALVAIPLAGTRARRGMAQARATRRVVAFRESPTLFPNPERGWHFGLNADAVNNITAPPVTLDHLRDFRAQAITLVRKYYLLYEYKTTDIPQSYLDGQVAHDLDTARRAGMKWIPRFTYTWNLSYAPGSDEDVPAAQILRHLDQIGPILRSNVDVISHMEMGFVGFWGEWHDSTSDNLDADGNLNDSSRAILAKILDVLPNERMALIRYPRLLMQLYPAPLSERQAYTGVDQARIGLHDDGVLYDETHFGNYPAEPDERRQQRAFQQRSTRYAVMSGEPGGLNPSQAYALKVDPFVELATMHWRSLSMNQGDSGDLYAFWQDRGAYDEIGSRLGYRFSLVDAEVPERAGRGGAFGLACRVQNSGFGAPHNPRSLEVVLRHAGSGEEYFAVAESDPRRWWPGQTTRVEVAAALAAEMPAGEYDLFLHLPDPAPGLYGRPAYSIRFANDDVWEDFSGYNALGTRVRIDDGEGEPGAAGIPAFQRRAAPPQPPAAEPAITLMPRTLRTEPAPAPEVASGDVLVDFADRPAGDAPLTGAYRGLDWSAGGAWRTTEDANGRYLSLDAQDQVAEAAFSLPAGKVLKSIGVLKRDRRATRHRLVLRSEGNPDYVWENPAPWWAQHALDDWRRAAAVAVRVEADGPLGARNIVFANLVYGDPPPPDVVVDFQDLAVGQTLTGVYGGIDWGASGLWQVGVLEGDTKQFVFLDSRDRERDEVITLPAGMVLKGAGMRKRAGENDNGDRIRFTIVRTGDIIGNWGWIPVDSWENGYGLLWSKDEPHEQVSVQIRSEGATEFNVGNVLIGMLTYGVP